MLPSPPYTSGFYADRATAQSILDLTWTVIVFNNSVYDLHGEYSTSTGIFTAKKEGYYLCNWRVTSENTTYSSTSRLWLAALAKNNAVSPDPGNFFCGFRFAPHNSQTVYAVSMGSVIVDLDASDTLRVKLLHNVGSPVNTHASAHYNCFSVRRIGLS
jgi:hypothetical protein